MPDFDLSIIIPAYNEHERLRHNIELIRAFAQQRGESWELIVVDDGSADGTADSLADLDAAPLAFKLLKNPGNRGKGYSVRRGMLEAAGQAALMTDADLSTPIEELDKLRRALLPMGEYDIAIGSRDMPESRLEPAQPWMRHTMGLAFRQLRRLIGLVPDLRDTQCGFKLFTHEAAKRIFAEAQEDGFAFDCEALALAQHMGYRTLEVGVRWCNEPDSRVRPLRDPWRMFKALWRIRRQIKHRIANANRPT